MEILSIYYDDNTNSFTDEYGNTDVNLLGIMTYDDVVYYKRVGGTYYRDLGSVMCEIDFPIRDQERILYYNIDFNIWIDEDGEEMLNIFSIVSPNQLFMFKKNKENMITRTINGGYIELIYGGGNDDESDFNIL